MKNISGRLVRVYLCHPLHDGRPFLSNLRAAGTWRGIIDMIPGVKCWAPWIDLAETDPDEGQRGKAWEQVVMGFCLQALYMSDVVLVVGKLVSQDVMSGITLGQGIEMIKAAEWEIPMVSMDKSLIRRSGAADLIARQVKKVCEWPG